MTDEIDPKLLINLDEKFGAQGPVLYILAFNKEGQALLFTKKDLGVARYGDQDEPFQDLGESRVTNIRTISVIVTETGHFVQAYDVKSPSPEGGGEREREGGSVDGPGGAPPPPPCPGGAPFPCVKTLIRYGH